MRSYMPNSSLDNKISIAQSLQRDYKPVVEPLRCRDSRATNYKLLGENH